MVALRRRVSKLFVMSVEVVGGAEWEGWFMLMRGRKGDDGAYQVCCTKCCLMCVRDTVFHKRKSWWTRIGGKGFCQNSEAGVKTTAASSHTLRASLKLPISELPGLGAQGSEKYPIASHHAA